MSRISYHAHVTQLHTLSTYPRTFLLSENNFRFYNMRTRAIPRGGAYRLEIICACNGYMHASYSHTGNELSARKIYKYKFTIAESIISAN